MTIVEKGLGLRCQIATGKHDILACQELRHLCFFGYGGVDQDAFDACSCHLMIVDCNGALQGTLRYRIMHAGSDWADTYSGARYDIQPLSGHAIEIGRFCVRDTAQQARVLRVAMAYLTGMVDAQNIKFLVGCASFDGIDPSPYAHVLRRLNDQHLVQYPIVIEKKSPSTVCLDTIHNVASVRDDRYPTLLKSYVALGGKVSDHAVIDHQLDTLHVLVVVDIDHIPTARAKALRALAAI